jgi:GNAT superfamily N-acetyltransferase
VFHHHGTTQENKEMIQLVKATASDAEILMQICVQAFAEDIEQWGGPIGIDRVEAHLEWMETYLYYKIEFGGKTVGGVLVDPQDGNQYVLSAMYIAPEYQNQGIGTRTIGLLERAHPTAQRWLLSTAYSSHKSQRFYEKLGYERVGETEPGAYPGIPDRGFYLILYEKTPGGERAKG